MKRWLGVLALAVVLAIALQAVGCGHTVRGFDLAKPPCAPAELDLVAARAQRNVIVRFLGVSGLYLEWGEVSLLAGPFFTNPGIGRVLFGSVPSGQEALEEVAAGLQGIDLDALDAVLVGHSHYDHLADVPRVAELAPHLRAERVLANREAARLLAAWEIDVEVVEDVAAAGYRPVNEAGEELPIRIHPLPATHAPHLGERCFGCGESGRRWTDTKPRLRQFHAGVAHAYVIDLLAEDLETVRFRIYYQDTASPLCVEGEPCRFDELAEAPVDLAVLAMASYHRVEGQPADLLERLEPRHVLLAHYETFTRSRDRPLHLVKGLSEGRAESFLTAVEAFAPVATGPPLGDTCGPSTETWTLPLPGEWMAFSPAEPAN